MEEEPRQPTLTIEEVIEAVKVDLLDKDYSLQQQIEKNKELFSKVLTESVRECFPVIDSLKQTL